MINTTWKSRRLFLGSRRTFLLGGLLALGAAFVQAQSEIELIIGADAAIKKLTKISLSGFTGEALSTLKFDLEVAGCAVTSPEQAQYLLSGSNNNNLEGQVTDAVSKQPLFRKAYSDAPIRAQAHAFADAFVEGALHRKGIAQTKIAFRVDLPNGSSEICVADYDGHNPVIVTQDRSIVAAPCWVPGKRALYYTSYRAGNPDIYFHDLSTRSRNVIARYTGLNTSPAVSPDGRRVAMILSKAGSPDLWVSDAEGKNLKQLTSTAADESSPCWSPDGKTICVVSRLSGRAALYTIPAEGGTMRRLPISEVINTTEPDWSPDGKYIVYTSLMGSFQICITKVGTSETSILAPGQDPCWAPNSRTVIFVQRSGGNSKLSLLDVPTKRVKDIARISGNSSQPSWAK